MYGIRKKKKTKIQFSQWKMMPIRKNPPKDWKTGQSENQRGNKIEKSKEKGSEQNILYEFSF